MANQGCQCFKEPGEPTLLPPSSNFHLWYHYP
jgi:hypothetical protein